MIVNRITMVVKKGCRNELIELIKGEVAKSDETPGKVRLLWPSLGPQDMLVYEREFESLADLEAFWAAWNALPTTADFWNKYNGLTKPGGSQEAYQVL
jgi:hypothetical protein